tara:strand:- start:16720 stop:17388 length:669 start_codon:yes stop_codon:yes gene_type:complete
MEYAKISFRTVFDIPYPPHVHHLRTDILTLSEGVIIDDKPKQSIVYSYITKIRSLTKEQYRIIMYIGNHRNVIANWSKEVKEELGLKLLGNGLKYDVKKQTMYIKGIKLKLSDIELIGIAKDISPKKRKYIPEQTNGHGETFYYSYGAQHFDYYGTGIREAKVAWRTILDVIMCDTHFVIYKTTKVDKEKTTEHRLKIVQIPDKEEEPIDTQETRERYNRID